LKQHAGHSDSSSEMHARLAALLSHAADAGVVRKDVPIPFLTALLMALFTTYRELRGELGIDAARRASTDAFFRVALVQPLD
ncbi:MAG: hypothetical protein ACRDG3_04530, partial [Tepidiformaceae bacterium]